MIEIFPNIFLIPASTDRANWQVPKHNQKLFIEKDSQIQLDSFHHEIFLIIAEKDGMVIFTGCSHNGVCNMVDLAIQYFPDTAIKGLVGGFHLIDSDPPFQLYEDDKEIVRIADHLQNQNIDHIYTGHCTGDHAYAALKRILQEKISCTATGESYSLQKSLLNEYNCELFCNPSFKNNSYLIKLCQKTSYQITVKP